jgi:hypothetical protein
MGNVLSGSYRYRCPPGAVCPPDELADPPGSSPLCGCSHVDAANKSHCLQSMEITAAAQGEGFAQYFASLIWNERQGDCRFTYYKEVLGNECYIDGVPGACKTRQIPDALGNPMDVVFNLTPVPLDCSTPVKWRNTQQCGVTADTVSSGGQKSINVGAHISTEWDWLTFLRELNSTLTFSEIASVYRHACDLTSTPTSNPGTASSCALTWIDGLVSLAPIPPATTGTILQQHGFLSGAERAFGLSDDRYRATEEGGNLHGVSHDTMPLP